MSMNPFVLELLAKERQAELLALVQPRRIPISLGRQRTLGARLRLGAARFLVRIGMRLNPRGGDRYCPHHTDDGRGIRARVAWQCGCPARGGFPDCPPLQCG
ncbi:MAG: hypothetical protein QNJ22_14535 [Desulfosarcinaceae bacterium]|nr:hypothetical protein [Desulfosarcinaceae bacterium]